MGAVAKLDQKTIDEFRDIQDAYKNNVYEMNKSWNQYWHDYYKNKFTKNGLIEEVRYWKREAERVYKESESWLDENITLGTQIDKLKRENERLKEKNLELKDKIRLYENDKNLFKRYVGSAKLKAENRLLREHNGELKVKASVTGQTVLSDRQEKHIIQLYEEIIGKKGLLTKVDRELIAKKVGTSESTIYRRIKKHEQQQM